MYTFEKEILKREMLVPVCSYEYKVIPLSDSAKTAFALFNKRNGELERNRADLHKKYLKLDEFPFAGQRTFYYEDPQESEETRKVMVKELAIMNMADRWVPGISHHEIKKGTGWAPLIEGTDFVVEIGEKIVHEKPKNLTFDDIKAL
ncbi:hypothetical protein [Cytobacillus luteolus]|uniref:hypothetical protein n=1 Tax=Litchfieldia luteola TaxID=682179 RepID=UPI001AE649F8|nr:hypothetical protein [Cytobacillus luteolus]MBP1944633.1 hypothetical protein [Cytobacillus luteolus]